MNFVKTSTALVTCAAAIGSAHAGGLLGDAINIVAPGAGTMLDQANAQLGHPVEQAAQVLIQQAPPPLAR